MHTKSLDASERRIRYNFVQDAPGSVRVFLMIFYYMPQSRVGKMVIEFFAVEDVDIDGVEQKACRIRRETREILNNSEVPRRRQISR